MVYRPSSAKTHLRRGYQQRVKRRESPWTPAGESYFGWAVRRSPRSGAQHQQPLVEWHLEGLAPKHLEAQSGWLTISKTTALSLPVPSP